MRSDPLQFIIIIIMFEVFDKFDITKCIETVEERCKNILILKGTSFHSK